MLAYSSNLSLIIVWTRHVYVDLWFWPSPCRRTRPIETHDPGSGHTILSGTGNSHGRPTLFGGRRCMVGRLYIRWTARSTDIVSGAKSCTATGIDNGTVGHTVAGGHATCMRRGPIAHAETGTETAVTVRTVYVKFSCDARGRAFAVSNVGVWSGKLMLHFILHKVFYIWSFYLKLAV